MPTHKQVIVTLTVPVRVIKEGHPIFILVTFTLGLFYQFYQTRLRLGLQLDCKLVLGTQTGPELKMVRS